MVELSSPGCAGVAGITSVLPINIARELIITGNNLTAERAERFGLVNVVVEPGKALSSALILAEKICVNAPLAVSEAIGIFNTEVNGDESGSWKRSDDAHARLLETDDFREGWSAFFEKRTPKWTGR